MILFPAIDLYEGQAVRLEKGNFNRLTVYDTDPIERAKQIRDEGAAWIHIVDLEGARYGRTANYPIIKKITESTGLKIELGGGIRNLQTIQAYLDCGVKRVIIGTAAAEDESFLRQALKYYGEKIAVGVDILDGVVAVRGWEQKSAWKAEDFFQHLNSWAVKTVICTDISRDGMLSGSNHDLYTYLNTVYNGDLIASGGISDLDDLRVLKGIGMAGAILGKAYYSGKILLKEALSVAEE